MGTTLPQKAELPTSPLPRPPSVEASKKGKRLIVSFPEGESVSARLLGSDVWTSRDLDHAHRAAVLALRKLKFDLKYPQKETKL